MSFVVDASAKINASANKLKAIKAEKGYAETTSSVSITATDADDADDVVSVSLSQGSAKEVQIEFGCARAEPGSGSLHLMLFINDSATGEIATVENSGPVYASRRTSFTAIAPTPTTRNPSQVFAIRGWVDSGTGTVHAGTGGGSNVAPAWIAVKV